MEKGGIADSKDSIKHQMQANTLTYSIRKEADSILYSFGLSNDNRKKYNTVSNKYEAHFVK